MVQLIFRRYDNRITVSLQQSRPLPHFSQFTPRKEDVTKKRRQIIGKEVINDISKLCTALSNQNEHG